MRAALVVGVLVAIALSPAGPAAPAWAHGRLVSMSPADGSTVSVPPTQVVLTFDESIQDIGTAVVVTGPDGSRLDDGPPKIVAGSVTQALHPLGLRGHYAVSCRVVSADGHALTRTLGFDLSTGAVAVATSVPTAATTATPRSAAPARGAGLPVLLASAGALVLAGLVGVRIRLRRRDH